MGDDNVTPMISIITTFELRVSVRDLRVGQRASINVNFVQSFEARLASYRRFMLLAVTKATSSLQCEELRYCVISALSFVNAATNHV